MPTSLTSDDTPEWVKGDLPPAPPASPAPVAASATSSQPAERDGAPTRAPVSERSDHGEHAASAGDAAVEGAAVDVVVAEAPMAQAALSEVTPAEDSGAEHATAEAAVSKGATAQDAGAEPAMGDAAAADLAGAERALSEEQLTAEPLPAAGQQTNGALHAPDVPHPGRDQPPHSGPEPALTVTVDGADYSVHNTKYAIPNMPLAPDPANAIEALISTPLSLEAQVESLLFVADGAVPVGRLAEALEVSSRDIEAALTGLSELYGLRGLSLQRFRDKVQLTTSPAAASRVERFLGLAAATPLSRAALETLAIVAYQQPVTRPQIEAVRGVNSDSVIKNLLGKGLIEELGRAEGPGRPVLYSTTPEFMQHFGLASLSDLPPLSQSGPDGSLHPERILKG